MPPQSEACEMPLHRDIFWIGRQWAVTGFGMQAINQKHGGQFDIPIEHLWDDDLLGAVSGQKWFNPDDFNKGLEVARARHPRPLPGPASPVVSAVEIDPMPAAQAVPEPVAQSRPMPAFFEMRLASHSAKLQRVWRARRRR